MHEDEQEALQRLLIHKEGIVLVTGPTGSGKTTTLYSAIRLIQNQGVNIVTVEDPVEYRLGENIVQVQVHEKAGLTFASALRSILRQDPDVVLIGEIRDQETAQIALQASLTGHLVLSTLHTNDAPNAVTRLVDMGMEPYKIASALRGVVAQRLMRRLCTVCRGPSDEPVPERVARYIPAGTPLYKAVGCPECAMTGYRGRFSIMEVLTHERRARARHRPGRHGRPDRRRRARPTGWARCGRAGCGTCSPASPPSRSCSGSPTSPPRPGAGRAPRPEAAGLDAASGSAPPSPPRPPLPPPSAGPLAGGARRWSWTWWTSPDAAAAPAPPRAARGTKVLLVEDEEQLRRVMKDLLEREGYIVAEARDGVQALDQVDRHAPDIIVLDLNLPGLDGYSVLQQLRSRPATRAHSGHGARRPRATRTTKCGSSSSAPTTSSPSRSGPGPSPPGSRRSSAATALEPLADLPPPTLQPDRRSPLTPGPAGARPTAPKASR